MTMHPGNAAVSRALRATVIYCFGKVVGQLHFLGHDHHPAASKGSCTFLCNSYLLKYDSERAEAIQADMKR